MLVSLFHNMTLIISFIFIGVRLRKFIMRKTNNNSIFRLILPIIVGLLSTTTMMEPFKYKKMIFDLRHVPVFLITYGLGWKKGLFSIIPPTIYQVYLGENTAKPGVILGLLLPVLIGHIFYDYKKIKPLLVKINIKEVLTSYLIFSIIKSILQFFVIDIPFKLWIKLTINVTIFSLISLFIILLIIKDINQSTVLKKELERKANYDVMTGLPNLNHFKNKAKEAMKCKTPIIIIMVDIDNFKDYNDIHGHPAGNKALQRLAKILKNNTRNSDLVARYGGEEFILGVPNISNKEEAFFVAKRFRMKVEKYQFEGEEALPNKNLTISLGISSISYNKSLDELIQEADKALYSSKNKGKNCINFFDL
ncbi:GGDEF domain-containing protein [Sporohalobacter salinus]|uniref:GGDEF domain-containing protein n=1 Tax=Sporohalobacter salinus TaxID=1494606 RepID=UPI0019614EE2|nr:GGDEF domain-containing protein [Sporohalobacter salinus]MBM7624233.1 diguanylate cyclase [Sporohalobacter salinus]